MAISRHKEKQENGGNHVEAPGGWPSPTVGWDASESREMPAIAGGDEGGWLLPTVPVVT